MIEKYIQFAIDNGFIWLENFKIIENLRIDNVNIIKWLFISYVDKKEWFILESIERILSSKPFIEAIARGISEKKKMWYESNYNDTIINIITTQQAIAIRENKLDEFIINLLGEWNQ